MRQALIIGSLILAQALLLGVASFAHAQGTFVPLAPAPQGTRLADLYGQTSLVGFFKTVFNATIAIGAILAVLRLGFAGYLYMASDAWGQKSRAKEIIGDVILGLLLLLSIVLILRQINPNLLNLDFTRSVQQINPSAAGASSGGSSASGASGGTGNSSVQFCNYTTSDGYPYSAPCN